MSSVIIALRWLLTRCTAIHVETTDLFASSSSHTGSGSSLVMRPDTRMRPSRRENTSVHATSAERNTFNALLEEASKNMDIRASVKQHAINAKAGVSSSKRTKGKGKGKGNAGALGETRSLDEMYGQTARSKALEGRPHSMSPSVPEEVRHDSRMDVDGGSCMAMDVDSPAPPQKPPSKRPRISSPPPDVVPRQPRNKHTTDSQSMFHPTSRSTSRSARPGSSRGTRPGYASDSSSVSNPHVSPRNPPGESLSASSAPTSRSSLTPPKPRSNKQQQQDQQQDLQQASTSAASTSSSRAPPAPNFTQAPRASQRPPALGMRGPPSRYSAASTSLPRASQSANKIPAFRPPLSQAPHKIPAFIPPRARPLAPVEQVQPAPVHAHDDDVGPAEADSSVNYGDLSFDVEQLNEAMRRYD